MSEPFELSAADLARRRRLRRHKAFAGGLLLVAAVVFLLVRPIADDGVVWAGFVLAASEAAMVGGLADWFAVTALFRRPLGIPIPHTALIPTRKRQLGDSLGDFVGENFLSVEVVSRRLEQADAVGKVGRWLSAEDNARRVAGEAANAVRGALEVLSDDDVRGLVDGAITRRLRATLVAPVLGRVLGQVVADDSHRPLVDLVVARTRRWLEENPDTLMAVIADQAPDWSPEFLDKALARRVYKELVRIAYEVDTQPDHLLRRTLDAYLVQLSRDLQDDPATRLRVQVLVRRLLAHEGTRDAFGTIFAAARTALMDLVDEPEGELRIRTVASIRDLGGRLAEPGPLRDKADRWVSQVVEHVVTNYRDEITRTITDTVDRWDGAEAARRIELTAGPDLQFIRVNGTIVGALAGLVIHAVAVLLGS